jgi:transposase
MGEGDQHKMIKRIGQSMRFYTFKQRLQYKCYLNGIGYKEVDEYCTSKCCSSCGNFKKDLGSAKTYNCTKCGLVTDRDINAAKNIYVKSIVK